MKKVLAILIAVLMLVGFAACGSNETPSDAGAVKTNTDAVVSDDSTVEVGEGATKFDFVVVSLDGTEKKFLVSTDKTTVGEALIDANLIAGEESAYGLYVKTVDGTTLDYDKDGKYWAFYIDGEYAMTGVDATDIEAGRVYTFKAE